MHFHREKAVSQNELRGLRHQLLIEPDNVASRGLATKLGFRQESDLLRDRLRVGDQYRGVLMYGLLQADWESMAPRRD